MKHIAELLKEAKQGNDGSMIELIQRFDPLIIKLSSRMGKLDEDCRQHLTIEFLLAVQKFNLNRFN